MKIVMLGLAVFLFSGCATAYYVGHGQETAFKSMQECHLAHPDDAQYCVDRAQYRQAQQSTVMLILGGIAAAALVIFAVGSVGQR